MRKTDPAEEDPTAGVTPRVPWRVTRVRVLSEYRLHVRFVDGTEGEVDVHDLIWGDNPGVFEVLRNPDVFARAHIHYGAVTWPGELDLAPDAMYDDIRANGVSVPR